MTEKDKHKKIIGQTGSGKTERITTMLNKNYREERSFDREQKTFKQQKKLCVSCNAECEYIGTKNTREQYKSYCCDCYSKLDKHFIRRLWCKKCNMVKLENIKIKNLKKYFVPVDYVVSLLEHNCNYSPKMLFIEIQNMLRIAKKKKDVA